MPETDPQTYEAWLYQSAMAGSHGAQCGHEHQGWDDTCSECELGCRQCNVSND